MPETRHPVSRDIELRTWRIRALNVLSLVVSGVGALAVGFVIGQAIRTPERWKTAWVFIVIYLFAFSLAIFQHLDYRWRTWGLLLLGYGAGVLSFARGGLAGDGPMYLLVLPVLATTLLGMRAGAVVSILGLLTFAFFAAAASLGWLENSLVIWDNPLTLVGWADKGVVFAMLLIGLVTLQQFCDRFQAHLLQEYRGKEAELKVIRARLLDIEQHARQLEAVVRASHDATRSLESEDTLQHTVRSIREHLDFDTVALYLADGEADEAHLRAIAGPAKPDGVSQTIHNSEFSVEKTSLKSGDLLFPLQIRGKTIGALRMQLEEGWEAFGNEDIAILQMMAQQIAAVVELDLPEEET